MGRATYGGIAQLVEHLLCKQGVIGSSPFTSTKKLFGASAKPEVLWGEEEQGSGADVRRGRRAERSGLCGDEGQ